MAKFRLPRPGQLDLAFEGRIISEADSKDENNQPRWTVIRIYQTESGRYVVETVGVTVVEGERDRVTVQVFDTPEQVIEGLKRTRPDGFTYLTKLGLEVLDLAADEDPAFVQTVVEAI